MAKKPTSRRNKGTFPKGRSGNPNGRRCDLAGVGQHCVGVGEMLAHGEFLK